LSRQWKNILYTPLLLEHNFKSRHHNLKPLNVTFAVSDAEEVCYLFNQLLFIFFFLNNNKNKFSSNTESDWDNLLFKTKFQISILF